MDGMSSQIAAYSRTIDSSGPGPYAAGLLRGPSYAPNPQIGAPAQMMGAGATETNHLAPPAAGGAGGGWGAFFSHPDVQNLLGTLRLDPSALFGSSGAFGFTSPITGAVEAPGSATALPGQNTTDQGSFGASPNWLSSAQGAPQVAVGQERPNPYAGANYLGMM